MRNNRVFPIVLSLLLVSGCSLAPDFAPPAINTPDAYKEAPQQHRTETGEWQQAQSLEQEPRGQWWAMFGDATLNSLQEEAAQANPTAQAALARVEQARATVTSQASTWWPTLGIGANAVRSKPSSAGLAAFGNEGVSEIKPYTLYSAQGILTHEVDLFGRVRDNEKALRYDAERQEADYHSMLLALQADVAQHYFSLRALDAERALLRGTADVRKEALRIMQRRFDIGEAGELDLTRSETDYSTVQAELLVLDQQRAELENALSILLGRMPSGFTFAEVPLAVQEVPPHVPAGLPSTLLQRRPDITAAHAAMAAANTRIGVARTGYFPILNLTATAGTESTELGDLFEWSNRSWALGQLAGSALTMTIFDNGRTGAKVDRAHAAYAEAVANYRQSVLSAFRDVENALSGQRLLAQQAALLEDAAVQAQRTLAITQMRYDEGDAPYFEVVETQRNTLQVERAAVQTRGKRYLATIALIRALGGGWDGL